MKSLLQNSEVYFWSSLLNLMDNSPFVQKTIRFVYPIIKNEELIRTGKVSTLIGFSGLIMGIMSYMFYYLAR
ncbi:MAG: hypothetical protein CL609_01620 [Anaerolineaceae bacterium]|nr:hypothetical protein [Anaerolineaceae bacterium]